MSKATLSVPDISCEHCERAISKALGSQPGVRSVRVDVPAKQVLLEYDERQLSLDQVRAILEEEDYPVESAS
jgi:copper chaperone